MKKTQLSSTVFMWITFGLGIVGILMMFVPCVYIDAKPTSATNIFFSVGNEVGAWPSFIGYMLLVAGTLATGFVALPMFQPSRKLEMILLVSATASIIVGTILVMLMGVFYSSFNGKFAALLAGPYITLGLSVCSIAANVYAIRLDW